eukprot:TRINITY_DN33201_c0_g1_i1.p1 TRINITY_DN33201_c0_g1~~TRINITY_DN33201_c0_g1_i1.p1  ORF type:complete len:495 (-),score=84.22 TRINITY_DN33201_c0_g1_i1:31-1515(-)
MLSTSDDAQITDASKWKAGRCDLSCEHTDKICQVDVKVDKLLQLVSGVFGSTVPSTCKPSVLPCSSSPTCALECGGTELVSGMKHIQRKMNAIEASLAKISDAVEETRTALKMEAVQIAMQMSESDSLRFREACINAGIAVRSPGDAMQSRLKPSDAVQKIASVPTANEAGPVDDSRDSAQEIESVPAASETDLRDSPDDIELDTDVNSIDDELRMQRAQHAKACRLAIDPAFRKGRSAVSGQQPWPGYSEHSTCGTSFGSCLETSSQASVVQMGETATLAHGDSKPIDPRMSMRNDSRDGAPQQFPALAPHLVIEADARTMKFAHPADVVAFVRQVHQESVRLHKSYDDIFRRHVELKHARNDKTDLTCDYTDLKAAAASRFQALSRATGVAAEALSAFRTKEHTAGSFAEAVSEAHALVQRLQKLQHKRVQIVFAHHVEQCQNKCQPRDNCKSAKKQLGARERQKLASADEEIEETMSELRHCEADLLQELQ